MESCVQLALRKELHINPFVERFETGTVTVKVITTWKNLRKHCIFAFYNLEKVRSSFFAYLFFICLFYFVLHFFTYIITFFREFRER